MLDVRFGAVRLLITGRSGGSSVAPFAGLNLSTASGDDRAAQNRCDVADHLDIPVSSLVFLRQVHGNRVLTAVEVVDLTQPNSDPDAAVADAAVVSAPGVAVAVTAADCLPLLLADRGSALGAAAHVGRRGLASGVARRCLAAFVAAGAVDPVAVLGPAIGACCYQVAAELRDEVDAQAPGAAAVTRAGAPALDLRRALRQQLTDGGLTPSDLTDVDRCTAEDSELFSYRRDGVTGRFAGIVAITADGPA